MSSSPLRLESEDDRFGQFVANEVRGDGSEESELEQGENENAEGEPLPFDAGHGFVPSNPLGADVATQVAVKESTVIWGTTVNIKETMTEFYRFLSTWDAPRPGSESRYTSLIRQVLEKEMSSMNLDCQHLKLFNEDLYNQLVRFPQEVIPIFDIVLSDYAGSLITEEVELQVRPFNLDSRDVRKMRELNPKDIDQLLCIQGMIIRSSSVVPDLRQAFFRCLVCSHEVQVDIDRGTLPHIYRTEKILLSRGAWLLGRIKEPTQCKNCLTRNTYQLIHNRSLFSDKQYIKLQETVESIPEGETPHTVTLCVYDALVDVARPGDRVQVTGIYRAHPIRPSTKNRQIRQVYRTYIDVVHFRRLGKRSERERRIAEANVESEFYDDYEESHELTIDTDLRKAMMEEVGRQPDVYQRLVDSFAPSIWSLEDVKKGILCMLFGGASKSFKRKNDGKFRSDINVLLCGDPGTSKSQLLQYVHKIAPRGIYTSGKGSSAVGLTAYVSRDPDTGEAVLESGALVLSDQGVCCIDEFDKMDDMTRSILHEAMEQQTVSVAKAGIICSLNARTSILASANPKESKYNPNMSVVENLQLPPTLLSRFDLIYLILDKADPETDRKLANHLVSLYFEHPETRGRTALTTQELGEYIAYARANCNPTISDEAADRLVEGYVEMRQVGAGIGAGKRVVSATTRQLESCIRLAEALARMELSSVVLDRHVQEALRLMKAAIQAAATDPRTGQIDMDLITTGRSATARSVLKDLYTAVKAYLQELPSAHTISLNDLFNQFRDQASGDVNRSEFEEVLTQLAEEDLVLLGGPPRARTVRRLY